MNAQNTWPSALAIIILYNQLLWPDKGRTWLLFEQNEVVFWELHTQWWRALTAETMGQGKAGPFAKQSQQNSSGRAASQRSFGHKPNKAYPKVFSLHFSLTMTTATEDRWHECWPEQGRKEQNPCSTHVCSWKCP